MKVEILKVTQRNYAMDLLPVHLSGQKNFSGKIFAPPGVLDGGISFHFYNRLKRPKKHSSTHHHEDSSSKRLSASKVITSGTYCVDFGL